MSVIYTATHEIRDAPIRATVSVKPAGDTTKYTPVAVALTPYRIEGNANGQFAYIANIDANLVSVIDTAKSALVKTIPVGRKPVGIMITPVCLALRGGACNPRNHLDGTRAYVVNSLDNTVSVIDVNPQSVTFNQVKKTINVGRGPSSISNSKPLADGTSFSSELFAYVTNSDDSTVSVIDTDPLHADTTFNTVVATIDLKPPGTKPVAVAFDHDSIAVGKNPAGIALTVDFTGSAVHENFRAYVTNRDDDSFTVIDIEPGSPTRHKVVTTTLLQAGDKPTGVSVMYPDEDFVYINKQKPRGISIHPDNFKAYVANSGDSTASVVDMHYDSASRYTEVEEIKLDAGKHPVGVGVNHVGNRAYITNSGDNTVSVLDTQPGSPQYHTIIANIPVGKGPLAVAFGPVDSVAYVTNSLEDTVSVIDTASNTVIATVKVGQNPQHVFINLGERTAAYVANKGSNTVSIVDIQAANPTFNSVLDSDGCSPAKGHPCSQAVGVAPVGVVLS